MTTASRPRHALFLTPAEAGELLGCSDETVRRLIRDGAIKAERRGRNYKVPRAEIDRLAGTSRSESEEDRERHALVKQARQLIAELGVVMAKLEG